ncbi:MAG: hypothetical protein K8R99_08080 [Actinomycetia bacterium]|nr:hypothetical protein [Actinomycetes bacterium]
MAGPKREDLAKRFDQRLKQAPARGAIVATQTRATPTKPPSRPAAASNRAAAPVARARPSVAAATRPAPARVGRGAAGRRLRGHLVPRELHGEARRRKLRLEAEQQRRITWDEVATQALELLIAKRAQIPNLIDEVRTIGDKSGARRLVQSTIPFHLDRMFSELRLDLSDKHGRDVSYEVLWSSALLLWVRSR